MPGEEGLHLGTLRRTAVAKDGRHQAPFDVAVDLRDDSVYVSDTDGGRNIDKYDSLVIEGTDVLEVAGTYDRQYGNYAKWRGTASIGWALEPFTALLSARYIHSLELIDPDLSAVCLMALTLSACAGS